MVYNAFMKALKNSGLSDNSPSYDKYGHYYTAMKLIEDDSIIESFKIECERMKIKHKVTNYYGDIWSFKAYNK